MIDLPRIIQTPRQPAAVVRLNLPRAEMRHAIGTAVTEIRTTLSRQNIGLAGPFFCHHFRIDPHVFDLEVGVPTMAPITPGARVVGVELPHAAMARTVYHGGYEGLDAAWGEFTAWIREQQHLAAPDLWESYLCGPVSDPALAPARWKTEFYRPLTNLPPALLSLSDLIPHLEAITVMSDVDLPMRRLNVAWHAFQSGRASTSPGPHENDLSDLIASFSRYEPNPQFCNRAAGMYDAYDLQQRVRQILVTIQLSASDHPNA